MGPIIFKALTQNGTQLKILAWVSDNEPVTDGCDAVIGYGIFQDDAEHFMDGGEMDCRGDKYADIKDTARDLADYLATDVDSPIESIEPTDEDTEDYEDKI